MKTGDPLDLNNFPGDDYSSRDHDRQLLDDTSSSAAGVYRRKKNSGKVYECRFCSLKFGKSQALGGHMNRHRLERETETLNRARHLVFTNDNIIIPPAPPSHHHLLGTNSWSMSSGQPIQHGAYHHHHHNIQTSGDPFRSPVHPAAPRIFSGPSTSTIIPPPPYMYPSPSRLVNAYSSPHYNINNNQKDPTSEYFTGHVLSGANAPHQNYPAVPPDQSNSYTCIGAPVGVEHGFGLAHRVGGSGGRSGGRDIISSSAVQEINSNDKEVEFGGANISMGRTYGGASGTATQQCLGSSSMINRYQDQGF